MPITARLSNKFYEKLGDDVANELVEWLNLVDTSYRQEFRDLFEANFGRVDARMGGLETGLVGRMSALEARLEARIAGVEQRLTDLEARLETRFAGVEKRMGDLEERLIARMDAKLESMKSGLLTWTLVFWLGTMGTVLAIVKL
jgi:hypothetical protein